MINSKIINEVKNRLIKTYSPLAIYIFGSYAWGNPTDDSDLDLLIVVEKSDKKTYTRSLPGQQALFGLGISKDLIIYTKDEFNLYVKDVSTLCYKIEKNGRLIYAKS